MDQTQPNAQIEAFIAAVERLLPEFLADRSTCRLPAATFRSWSSRRTDGSTAECSARIV